VPSFPSLARLDALVGALPVGDARRRQLGMIRRELEIAMEREALPPAARRSLPRLLHDDSLRPYLRLAESGALRTRLVNGLRPPTSAATNQARLDCLSVLREAAGLPRPRLGGGAAVLRPVPDARRLAALRRRLGDDLTGRLPAGRIRLTAAVALVLDTAARSGELIALRTADVDLAEGRVRLARRPQHGLTGAPAPAVWTPLSPLGRAALARWLPVREDLVRQAHGTTRLWVSLRPNHDGVPDANGVLTARPAGMPLRENGLVTSYREGRHRYGLEDLLPPKLEQLRRAARTHSPAEP
jgi:integrase